MTTRETTKNTTHSLTPYSYQKTDTTDKNELLPSQPSWQQPPKALGPSYHPYPSFVQHLILNSLHIGEAPLNTHSLGSFHEHHLTLTIVLWDQTDHPAPPGTERTACTGWYVLLEAETLQETEAHIEC
jgi:hypothetical protein